MLSVWLSQNIPFIAEHAWFLHESDFLNALLTGTHCVLGWMCNWGRCM